MGLMHFMSQFLVQITDFKGKKSYDKENIILSLLSPSNFQYSDFSPCLLDGPRQVQLGSW